MQTDRDFRAELDALDETPTVSLDSEPAKPLTQTGRDLVDSGVLDRMGVKRQIEEEEARESARRESHPLWQEAKNLIVAGPAAYLAGKTFGRGEGGEGALGTIGLNSDDDKLKWIADEKVSAERSLAFWDSIKKTYGDSIKRGLAPVLDYSPQGLLARAALNKAGVLGDDDTLGDQFGGWLNRKTEENIALAKRRRMLAEEMEAGARAAPKFGAIRSSIDDTARGLSRVFGSAVKGVAYGIESGDLIKVNPLVDGYIVDTLKRAGYISGNPSEAQKRNIYQFGAWVENEAQKAFPEDEARANEFRKALSEGVGSMIAFMGTGYAAMTLGKGAGVATIVSGMTGGLSQAGSMTDDALKKYLKDAETEGRKLTPEEERKATQVWLLGLGIGATEAVPLANFFAGHSGRFVRGVLLQATEEGGQEWVQQVLENVVAQRMYDPERKWDDNAWEGLAIGAILGAKMQAGQAGVERLRGKKPEEPAKDAAPAKTEERAPDVPPMTLPDVAPSLDGTDGGPAPKPKTRRASDPGLDKYRQTFEAVVPSQPNTDDVATRRVLGKGLEEIVAETEPNDAVSRIAGVVSKGFEQGKIPTMAEVMAVLPKDERGDPDMGRLADELDKVGVRAWNGLSDDQRRQIYEAVAPVVQAVEANPEAVAEVVRQVVGAAPAETKPKPAKPNRVVTPDGSFEFEATPEIVDLTDLRLASGDMQPRDRTRQESDAGVAARAAALDPSRLMPGRVSDSGAPIVSPDGTIISGNGRVMSIAQVYDNPALADRAKAYRDALGPAAEGMQKPVLVQRLPAGMSREDLVRLADLSNRSSMAGLSASERAVRDARAAGPGIMTLYTGGSFLSPANQEFFRAFVGQVVTDAERPNISRNGVLSKEGEDRMSAAVLAAAYGDSDLLSRMLESLDDNIRNVTGALRDAAGAFIRLKAAIASGEASAQFDITPQIVETARRIADLRDRNIKPDVFLAQQDAFNQIDPLVESLIRAFYNDGLSRPLSREKLTELLTRYANEAEKHQDGGLIPDETKPDDVIRFARDRALADERVAAGQGNLFGNRPRTDGGTDAGAGRATERPGDRGRGQPAREVGPVVTDAHRAKFNAVLNSKAKRSEWAKAAGVNKAQLDALVNEALADGRLKKTKAGGIARTGKKVDVKAVPATGQPSGQAQPETRVEPTLSTGQGTGQAPTMNRATERRLEAVKSDVARGYAQQLIDAGTDATKFSAIVSKLSKDKKAPVAVVHEVATVLTGETGKTRQDSLNRLAAAKPSVAVEPEQAPAEVAQQTAPAPAQPTAQQAIDAFLEKKVRIEDAGEKIGGARKDTWAGRGLNLEDLAAMSNGEQAKYVTKDGVWPKPDYAAMVDAGMPAEVAALVKLIRDGLAAKPKVDTPDGRRAYVTMMGHVRSEFEKVRSVEDISKARDRIVYDLVGWPRGTFERGNKEQSAVLFSVFKGRREALRPDGQMQRKARQMVADGFPGDVEPWTRRFSVRRWPRPDRPENYMVLNKQGRMQSEHLTEAEAKAAAKALYEAETAKTGDEPALPERPHLDNVVRTGKDIRGGRDVDSNDFLKDFGFRGIEFGNWVAGDERQKVVNLAYDALHDMANVLGIPPRAVSLNGTLGLAFGARGSGKFLAHYEPAKLVINMTKLRGAGSLAHEWAHALDHYFGELKRPDAYQGEARGASGWYERAKSYSGQPLTRFDRTRGRFEEMRLANIRPEMSAAFDGVMDALFNRDRTQADVVRDRELALERAQSNVTITEKRLATFEASDAKAQERNAQYGKSLREYLVGAKERVALLEKALAEARGPEFQPSGKVDSSFFNNAKKLSGKQGEKGYWARPTEMFARSFESYVFDKIAEAGGQSDYLAQGVEGDRYSGPEYKGNPYPDGIERDAINAAFERLFDTMESTPEGALYALTTPQRAITEDRARKAVRAALKLGKAVRLNTDTVEAMRDAMTRMPAVAPAGTVTGFLVEVRPLKKGNIRAYFETNDGSLVHFDGSPDDFIGSRAFFVKARGGPSIFHVRFATPGQDGIASLASERWHESIHALRAAEALAGPTWDLLLSHANSLRILEMSWKSYLQAAGDPAAENANPNATLIELYYTTYSKRMTKAQLQEALDQEAVAIMTELLVRGVDLPLPENIRSILAGIERGEFAGGAASVAADMPALAALGGGTIFSKETQEAKALSRHFGATRIEDIGPNDPHPGRVLAFHGTDRDLEGGRFDLGKAKSVGLHFGTAEQANSITSIKDNATPLRTIPAVLDLENVITLPDLEFWSPNDLARNIEAIVPGTAGIGARMEDLGNRAAVAWKSTPPDFNQMIRDALTAEGVDGIRYRNTIEGEGWSYIVWEPGKVISATSGNMLFALGGGTVSLDDKVKNIDAIVARIESMPKEQRRPFSDKFDVIINRGIDRVTYELVPKGKPLWKRNGSPNSVGTFQVKPSGRNEVTGVEVTNARLREEYQRQGIGTKIYDMIEADFADLGGLSPSPRMQLSPIAQSFWSKRLPQGMMFALGGFTPESDIDSSTGQSMRRDLDNLGFYSKALEAARALKQEKGTPEQMLAQLKKAGVKDAEIEATGLADLFKEKSGSTTTLESDAITLSQNPQLQGDRTASPPRRARLNQISKSEIVKYLEENRVGLREVNYGGRADLNKSSIDVDATADELGQALIDSGISQARLSELLEEIGYLSDTPGSRLPDAPEYRDPRTRRLAQAVLDAAHGVPEDFTERAPKWANHSLDPSNPTYRETVLHLPSNADRDAAMQQAVTLRQKLTDAIMRGDTATADDLSARLESLDANARLRSENSSLDFTSGHFPEPNIVGHMMTSMTRHEGKPVYTIDQIQSDWGQKLRDGGVRDEKKLADLKERADKTRAARDDFVRAYQEMLADGDRAKTSLGDANDRLSQLSATGDRYGQEWRRLWNDASIANAEWRTAEAAAVGHPLVNTTDQWTQTTLRRAIRQAVEAGAEYIAVPHGDTVLSYNPGKTDGMRGFYGTSTTEGIVPKNLRKLLTAIDRDVVPTKVQSLETPGRGLVSAMTPPKTIGPDDYGFTLFPLTDSVKRSVMEDGQPMFALGGGIPPADPRGSENIPSLNKVIQSLKDTLGIVPTQTLLGVTIKAGDSEIRLNPRGNVRGQTQMATGAIGVRKSRAIDVISHEAAHYLETTLGAEIIDLQTIHAAELAMINPAATPSEQWAEWFADYMLDPVGASARAPLLHSAVEDVLEANGMLEGIHETQDLYQQWLERATPEELASDVVSIHAGNSFADLRADRPLGETIPGRMATAYTNTIDDLNPLSKIVRKLLSVADRNGVVDDEGRPISLKVADNPYKIARMFRGSYATGYSWLTKGIANRGETSIAFAPLSRALETLFGSNNSRNWDPAMYQAAGQYLISRRAIAEYDRLEQKQSRLEEIDGLMEQGSEAWRQVSLQAQDAATVLERRETALVRQTALMRDRRNALKSAEATVTRLQERIQDKKDDVTAAQMARDANLTERRRRDLAIIERDSQRQLRQVEGLIEEYEQLSTDVAMLESEIDQLRQKNEAARGQLDGIDEAMAGLRREREATEKRGASRAPTRESKEWHQEFIAKTEADPKYARIKDFAAYVAEFGHGMLTLRHQAGLISDELFEELSKRKDWFVPFQRDMSDASPENTFFRGAGIEKWSPFKKFDGSDRAIINPLETMAGDAYSLAQQIAFNDATNALAKLAERAGEGGASIVQVLTREESAEANAATFDRVKNIAMSMGIDEADALRIVSEMEQNFAGSELSLIWSPATKGPVNLPTVPLYRDGERIMVRFTDPEFGIEAFNAMSGMGKETAGIISKILGYPSRLLQQGVTTHPTFIPRNVFRDIFDAWHKTGAMPVITQIRGVKAMRDQDFMRRYMEAGGITGGRNLAALTGKEQQLDVLDLAEKRVSKGNIALGSIAGGLLGATVAGPLGILPAAAFGAYVFNRAGALETVESAETMTRLGVAAHAYKRALAHNPSLSPSEAMLEAAFVSRDVFDWNRRGSKMIGIVRTITFLNAQIQGMDSAFRRLGGENDRGMVLAKHMNMVWRRENGGNLSADEERALGDAYKTFGRMALYTGLLLSLYALATSGGDDDDKDKAYQDIRDKTKITHSWLPAVFGTDVRLPKAFEWAMPANAIEAIADGIRGRNPHVWDRIVDSVYEIAVPPTVPQVLNLIMGLTANVQIDQMAPSVKRLLGREAEPNNPRQIVGDSLRRLDPEAQFDAWSSQLSIDVAKSLSAVGIPRDMIPSPKKIDFILRTGGYWGQDVQRGYQVLKEAFGGRQREAARISDLPVVAGFTGVAARQSRSRDELFRLVSQQGGVFTTAAQTFKNLIDEQGTPADAERFISRLEPDERTYALLQYYGSPGEKKTHPLDRLKAVDGVANKIRQDIILDRLAPIEKQGRKNVRNFDEKINLNPRQQTQVHEILERLMQAEAWNTMTFLEVPAWKGRSPIKVEPILAELRAANPQVYEIYEDRLRKSRARTWDEVTSQWPDLRDRILREGAGAWGR